VGYFPFYNITIKHRLRDHFAHNRFPVDHVNVIEKELFSPEKLKAIQADILDPRL